LRFRRRSAIRVPEMSDARFTYPEGNGANAIKAAADDPFLSVYVLTEFLFCPRAGLCAYESDEKAQDREPPRASLGYFPLYDLVEIENALLKSVFEFRLFSALAVVAAISAAALHWFVDPALAMFAVAGSAGFVGMTLLRLSDLLVLRKRRRECLSAQPREPDRESRERQPVRWWDLLRAGFESKLCHEPLVDEELKLGGRPWRVLHREKLRIPVWVLPRSDGELHQQHFVRMAAYCHLLQVSEASESPYGVILFGESYAGTTIPNGAAQLANLHQSLRLAWQVIRSSRVRQFPAAPEQRSVCSGCPHGLPIRYRLGESGHVVGGRSLPVVLAKDTSGHSYHSRCGDRFRWLPPHEVAIRRRLQLQA
jgi:hypothetical protein